MESLKVSTSIDEDEDEDGLDPRIQIELEKLNSATDVINKLEMQLDEANTTFRILMNDSTKRLKALSAKMGSSIVRARPYYEAVELSKRAQLECQRAAVKFQRANEIHRAAKETVALAEARFLSKQHEWQFDNAWQEMLNHATIRVTEAENQKSESGQEHQKRALLFNAAEQKVQQLQQRLKRSIGRSRVYFDEKAQLQSKLDAQKTRIQRLEEAVAGAKAEYAASLRHLELISEEIHMRRNKSGSTSPRGPREPGVGAELDQINMELPHNRSLDQYKYETCTGTGTGTEMASAAASDNLSYDLDLDSCDVRSLGSVSRATSSAVSEADDLENDPLEEDLEELKQRVRELAVRDDVSRSSESWENELTATINKLDNALLMRECEMELRESCGVASCSSAGGEAADVSRSDDIVGRSDSIIDRSCGTSVVVDAGDVGRSDGIVGRSCGTSSCKDVDGVDRISGTSFSKDVGDFGKSNSIIARSCVTSSVEDAGDVDIISGTSCSKDVGDFGKSSVTSGVEDVGDVDRISGTICSKNVGDFGRSSVTSGFENVDRISGTSCSNNVGDSGRSNCPSGVDVEENVERSGQVGDNINAGIKRVGVINICNKDVASVCKNDKVDIGTSRSDVINVCDRIEVVNARKSGCDDGVSSTSIDVVSTSGDCIKNDVTLCGTLVFVSETSSQSVVDTNINTLDKNNIFSNGNNPGLTCSHDKGDDAITPVNEPPSLDQFAERRFVSECQARSDVIGTVVGGIGCSNASGDVDGFSRSGVTSDDTCRKRIDITGVDDAMGGVGDVIASLIDDVTPVNESSKWDQFAGDSNAQRSA